LSLGLTAAAKDRKNRLRAAGRSGTGGRALL